MKKLVLAAALSLFAVGCGSPCVSVCEDAKECSNASDTQKATDCDAECDKAEDVADVAGCTDEFDANVECVAEKDVCNLTTSDCKSERDAYNTCNPPS